MASPQAMEELAREVRAAPLAVDRVEGELVKAVPHGRGQVGAREALKADARCGHPLALLPNVLPLGLLERHEKVVEVGVVPVLPVVLDPPPPQPALRAQGRPLLPRPE